MGKLRFETLAVHAGSPDPTTGADAPPIYQTAAYAFQNSDHAKALFNLEQQGDIYSRISNPTVAMFEQQMAALEGGVGALATSSGQAAEFIAICTLASSGDEIVSASSLYGGTYTLFDLTLRKFGITTKFINGVDPEGFRAAIGPKTKALYAETIGNPKLDVLNISKVAEIAHEADIPLIVDNTFATPYLCRPLEWGADIVIHSATKWIGGHGTSIGGVIVDGGHFNWANGKFPGLSEPDPGYHGIRYVEHFKEQAFIAKARTGLMRDVGSCLSPFNAFLFLQGLKTLPLRMHRHSENALTIAQRLAEHPKVSWVNYPGLSTHPDHELARRQLSNGFGGMVTFGIKGGLEAGSRFIDRLKLVAHLANVGDTKTLAIHPASTTHQQLTSEQRAAAGVPDDMIRLSVGIEAVEDIWSDIDQALNS